MRKLIVFVGFLFSIISLAQNSPRPGLKFTEIKTGSIYEQLGLKNGDIVRKVNGADPTSIESFGSQISNAKAGDKIDVVVERNKKEKTLHYTIK